MRKGSIIRRWQDYHVVEEKRRNAPKDRNEFLYECGPDRGLVQPMIEK